MKELSDYELIQIVKKDYDDYTEEALVKYKEEFKKRNLDDNKIYEKAMENHLEGEKIFFEQNKNKNPTNPREVIKISIGLIISFFFGKYIGATV